MTADDDRCVHRLPAGNCALCRRGLPVKPEPEPVPTPVADDDQDDDPFDRDLPWWQR